MKTMLGMVAILIATGCVAQFNSGRWSTAPPPAPPEMPTPDPFMADAKPDLVKTALPGLFAAPSLDTQLFYYEPHERWYRWALNRWYEAFSWDGHWFPPEKLPPEFDRMQPFKL